MSRAARTIVTFLLALGAVASTALADDDIVRHRTVLPYDGRALDVADVASPAVDPIRVRLSGTLSSTLDGSEIDAFARRAGNTRWEADGPFVRLPSRARVVSRDEAAHVYVVEIPRGGDTSVALLVAPLATRHLVTLSEAQSSLSGSIELAVLDPPPTATEAAMATVEDEVSGIPWFAYPLALGALGLLAGLGLLVARLRRRPERVLLRRVRAALARLEQEAAVTGPAFGDVVGTCRKLAQKAAELCRHVGEIDRALETTAWAKGSPGAEAKRDELRKARATELVHMRTLAERIEETTTALAAHRAGKGSRGVDDLLGALRHELDTAVSAEDEARAI